MKEWEIAHITYNLAPLIQSIDCNATLLGSLVQLGNLAPEDVQDLNAVGHGGQKIKMASKLLDILFTRTGAYEHLTKALYDCRQTEALLILLHGISKYDPSVNPFKLCGIELNAEEILPKHALFWGVTLPLGDICKPFDSTCLQQIIGGAVDASCYEQLLRRSPIVVATETIPEPLSYYISRTLSISTQLDPEIFHKLDDDIFCVEGLELYQLSSLAKLTGCTSSGRTNKSVDRSRNKIRRSTAAFILLEKHEHFQGIVEKSKNIVHWVRHQGGRYVHVKSSAGGVKRIQKFIIHKHQETFLEDEFIQIGLDATGNSPILIYDSPGKGKSVLLAELARKLKVASPERNVIYFSLPDFIQNMPPQDGDYTSAAIKQYLTQLVTTNSLGRSVVQNLLDTENQHFELFFDAYDELQQTDTATADAILHCISKKCANIRMWVATRPHRRLELENKFGVLGYNIMPFNYANKISFFVQYWESQHGVVPTDEVKQFVDHCLKGLTETMSAEEGDIAGVPLQCKMLADIFAEDAKRGCLVCTDSYLQFDSIYGMYKEFMEMKFSFNTNPGEPSLKAFHLRAAIRNLFSKEIANVDSDTFEVDKHAVYRLGILEPSRTDADGVTFVHKTYAEFLAAEYLVTSMTMESTLQVAEELEERVDLFLGSFWVTGYTKRVPGPESSCMSIANFDYPAIAKFLDYFFSCMPCAGNDLTEFKTFLRSSKYYKSDIFYILLQSLMKSNVLYVCTYVLDLYLDFGEFGENSITSLMNAVRLEESQENELTKFVNELREQGDLEWLVWTAVHDSSLEIVKLSCNLVESVTGKKWYEFSYQNSVSPIIISVQRGHYPIFEYLLDFNREQLYKQPLLHWCLLRSATSTRGAVADKVQIIKLILQERPDLLNTCHPLYNHVPLLAHTPNIELVKCMIEAGADINANFEHDGYNINITYNAASCFSAEEYHELVKLIVSRNANGLFKLHGSNGLTSVHKALEMIELKTETLVLLRDLCGVDFNDSNNILRKSELAIAIEKGRSDRVVNTIRRLGGDTGKMYSRVSCVHQ